MNRPVQCPFRKELLLGARQRIWDLLFCPQTGWKDEAYTWTPEVCKMMAQSTVSSQRGCYLHTLGGPGRTSGCRSAALVTMLSRPARLVSLAQRGQIAAHKAEGSETGLSPKFGGLSRSVTRRVRVPNTCGFWFQKPYSRWYLGPETLNIGYLDPLG